MWILVQGPDSIGQWNPSWQFWQFGHSDYIFARTVVCRGQCVASIRNFARLISCVPFLSMPYKVVSGLLIGIVLKWSIYRVTLNIHQLLIMHLCVCSIQKIRDRFHDFSAIFLGCWS